MPEITERDYPGNSYRERMEKRREGEKQKREIQTTSRTKKVIRGEVIMRKKSLIDRFSEIFFGDDAADVGSYVLYDVLIPAAKSTISEMISGGLEMLLFGETRGSNTRRDKGKSYVSYGNYYGRDRNRYDKYERRGRSRHKFDDIVISTRGEAEEVISTLVDIIEQYGVATVADFYDAVDVESDFTDDKYGWDNISRATVNRVRDGYIIIMPKPHALD